MIMYWQANYLNLLIDQNEQDGFYHFIKLKKKNLWKADVQGFKSSSLNVKACIESKRSSVKCDRIIVHNTSIMSHGHSDTAVFNDNYSIWDHIWPHDCLSQPLSSLCFTLSCFSCHICSRHLALTTDCVVIVWLNWFMQAGFFERSNDPCTDCWSQHKEQAQKTTKATAVTHFSTTPWWSLFWLSFRSSFSDLK